MAFGEGPLDPLQLGWKKRELLPSLQQCTTALQGKTLQKQLVSQIKNGGETGLHTFGWSCALGANTLANMPLGCFLPTRVPAFVFTPLVKDAGEHPGFSEIHAKTPIDCIDPL